MALWDLTLAYASHTNFLLNELDEIGYHFKRQFRSNLLHGRVKVFIDLIDGKQHLEPNLLSFCAIQCVDSCGRATRLDWIRRVNRSKHVLDLTSGGSLHLTRASSFRPL